MQRLVVLIVAAACLEACSAGSPSGRLPKGSLRLPLVRQSTPYTCGAAVMQSILRYYGEDIREDDLTRELESDPEEGTRFWRMLELALRHGIEAEVFLDASLSNLKTALDAGKPVIVAFQAWSDAPVDYSQDWDDGHYAVAIGYDKQNIYFMDPSTLGNYAFIPASEFLARWHDRYADVQVNRFMLVLNGKPDYDPQSIPKLE